MRKKENGRERERGGGEGGKRESDTGVELASRQILEKACSSCVL